MLSLLHRRMEAIGFRARGDMPPEGGALWWFMGILWVSVHNLHTGRTGPKMSLTVHILPPFILKVIQEGSHPRVTYRCRARDLSFHPSMLTDFDVTLARWPGSRSSYSHTDWKD